MILSNLPGWLDAVLEITHLLFAPNTEDPSRLILAVTK